MGCCSQTHEIIKPIENERDSRIDTIKNNLLQCVDILQEEYEKMLMEKIIPTKPRAMHEFDKLMKYGLHKVQQKYKKYTSTLPLEEKVAIEIDNYNLFLRSKCKSKEGFFSFLNNFYSHELVYQLNKQIIYRLNTDQITPAESVTYYSKLARGSYVLEGLQNLHHIIGLPAEQRLIYLEQRASSVNIELKENREQLLLVYNELPVKLIEETHLSLDALNAAECSYIESQVSEYEEELSNIKIEPSRYLSSDYKPARNNYLN